MDSEIFWEFQGYAHIRAVSILRKTYEGHKLSLWHEGEVG